jgi:hypothetical protein
MPFDSAEADRSGVRIHITTTATMKNARQQVRSKRSQLRMVLLGTLLADYRVYVVLSLVRCVKSVVGQESVEKGCRSRPLFFTSLD